MEGWRVKHALRQLAICGAAAGGIAWFAPLATAGQGSYSAPRTGSVSSARFSQNPLSQDPLMPEEAQPAELFKELLAPSTGRSPAPAHGSSMTPPSVLSEFSPPPVMGPVYEPGEMPHDEGELLHDPGGEWGMPAAVWSSGDWFLNGDRYAQVDFFMAHRTRPETRTGIGQDFFGVGAGVTNYGQPWGVEPGIRATYGINLGRDHFNRDRSVEFGFYGINEFNMEDGIASRGDNGIFTPLNNFFPGFNNADFYQFFYNSQIYGCEMNYKIRSRLPKDRMVMGPDGSWTRQYTHGRMPAFMVGVRYVSVTEDFLWQSRRSGQPVSEFRGDYNVSAENDLIGLQFGLEWFDQRETWYWGVRGKGGPYVNFASQESLIEFTVLNQNGQAEGGAIPREASDNMAAFFTEVNILGAYNLSPNWTIRTSLDLTVIGGLALAPDQLGFDFSPPTRILNDGVIFMQAVSVGMECSW